MFQERDICQCTTQRGPDDDDDDDDDDCACMITLVGVTCSGRYLRRERDVSCKPLSNTAASIDGAVFAALHSL